MTDAFAIRSATLSEADLDAFSRFVAEHVGQSGKEGSVHYALSQSVSEEEIRSNAVTRWSRALDEPNWGRAFIVVREVDNKVVGHAELKGGRLQAELHRATLGMGLLREYTGQGWGKRLLDELIHWAKRTRKLDWIDLGVFRHNERARRLYASAGFVEIGQRPDAFHVEGFGSVLDIQMALDLRKIPPR